MTIHHASVSEQLSLRVEATGTVIDNFSWQHMKAAVTFRDQVIDIEEQNKNRPFGPFFEDIRTYTSACIMSSAASLEALINEFFISPEYKLRGMLQDFESDFRGNRGIERKSPLKKYQKALNMIGHPLFNEKVAPFIDVWYLIELRNTLVHYKPTWDPVRNRRIELVVALDGKYMLSPFPDTDADFVTMRSMSAGCACWVVTTTFAFMREFHTRSKLGENKMSLFWKLYT